VKRLHLFEIEDQSWCPAVIRDGITDYLQFALNAAKPYARVTPRLADVLRDSGAREVVDLCSGGGGPWATLAHDLEVAQDGLRVRLTDRFPNVEALERIAARSGGVVTFRTQSVDATNVPPDLTGVRTMFSAFHHFAPDEARAVLADAARARTGIAVFEATHRSMAAILVTPLAPIAVLLLTPAIRPFKWSRLFWTYLVPVIPIATLFDGIVSCLRTYTPDELRALTASIPGHRWEAGELRDKGPIPVTYLIGVPLDPD
jgi:hypothetical protein